jgi:hypothetical protein
MENAFITIILPINFFLFSTVQNTIGILKNQWGPSETGGTSLYLFDTETGESSKQYGECGG